MMTEKTVSRLTSAVKLNLCARAAFVPRTTEDSTPLSYRRRGLI